MIQTPSPMRRAWRGALHHLVGIRKPGEPEVVILEGGLGHRASALPGRRSAQEVTAPSDALETLLAYFAITPVGKSGSGAS